MTEKTTYEHEARELKSRKASDPYDDFSRKALKNNRPPLGVDLKEKTAERSETDTSDLRDGRGGQPEADARGQSEKKHFGGSNDGVSSANPRVLSGSEDGDATFPYKSNR